MATDKNKKSARCAHRELKASDPVCPHKTVTGSDEHVRALKLDETTLVDIDKETAGNALIAETEIGKHPLETDPTPRLVSFEKKLAVARDKKSFITENDTDGSNADFGSRDALDTMVARNSSVLAAQTRCLSVQTQGKKRPLAPWPWENDGSETTAAASAVSFDTEATSVKGTLLDETKSTESLSKADIVLSDSNLNTERKIIRKSCVGELQSISWMSRRNSKYGDPCVGTDANMTEKPSTPETYLATAVVPDESKVNPTSSKIGLKRAHSDGVLPTATQTTIRHFDLMSLGNRHTSASKNPHKRQRLSIWDRSFAAVVFANDHTSLPKVTAKDYVFGTDDSDALFDNDESDPIAAAFGDVGDRIALMEVECKIIGAQGTPEKKEDKDSAGATILVSIRAIAHVVKVLIRGAECI